MINQSMKVGVLCECSGVVRDAFLKRGHDAISCDIKPTRAPGPHRHGDLWTFDWSGFDLLICHPDCTFLTCSAEWAYKDGPFHQKLKPETLTGEARRQARRQAVDFVRRLHDIDVPKIAIENPVGVLSSAWRKPDQCIQPFHFGDDASKSTCLWLKGLPLLKPYHQKLQAQGRLVMQKNGKMARRYGNQTDAGQNNFSPSVDRAELRSNTYPGIAAAMAAQWGGWGDLV